MTEPAAQMLGYNTALPPLVIPEYGRNVQNMIEVLKTIEDRNDRNKMAKEIVQMMAFASPQTRELGEYKQKLWHHLFFIAGNDLDVDAPYGKYTDSENIFENRAIKIDYPKSKIKYKHYGKALENAIEMAIVEEDVDKKQGIINYIIHFMRLCNANWNNKNTVGEEDLAENLYALSDGRLVYEIPENLRSRKITIATNKQNQQPTEQPKRRSRGGRNRKKSGGSK
jgi:hypothetical protein